MDFANPLVALLAVALTVGLTLVGVMARNLPRWAVILLLLGLAARLLLVDPELPVHDVWMGFAFFSLGAFVPARTAARLVVGALLLGLVAEPLARVALPPPPHLVEVPWTPLAWRLAPSRGEETCRLAFPDAGWRSVRALPEVDDARPAVLHLGDSMLVFGPPSADGHAHDRAATFVAALDRRDPDRQHLNLGMPGTGQDAQLAIARAWSERTHVASLVVYALGSNDLTDLLRTQPCCPGGALVLADQPGAPPACEVPLDGTARWTTALRRSPAPLLLQVLTAHSSFVAHVRARAITTASRSWGWSTDALDLDAVGRSAALEPWTLSREEHILAAFAALAEQQHATLDVVLLPDALALPLAPQPERYARITADGDAILAICRGLGLACHDARVAFADVDPREPGWFLDDETHFDVLSHGRLAAWLTTERIPPSP